MARAVVKYTVRLLSRYGIRNSDFRHNKYNKRLFIPSSGKLNTKLLEEQQQIGYSM